MILLLGSSGYVGTAFRQLMKQRRESFLGVSRRDTDYTNRDRLIDLIRETHATFLINAAGYTGKPTVDSCEHHKAECLNGNAVLPGLIREACEFCNLPWGHVSSGCIYTGSRRDGGGFTESDPPNFCFRTNNGSFYSGSKALGEECLEGAGNAYLWRLRIPFDHVDSHRNYLSKLLRYQRLLDATNSLSHLGEFASASLDCWQRRVPFGTYNVTNTGCVTTRQVVNMIVKHLQPDRAFHFFADEAEFMRVAATTPRSNCVLDNSKLLSTGVQISDVEEALEKSLRAWQPQTQVGVR